MPFSINNFKSAIRTGGARSSLFEVRLTNPANGSADFDFPMFCQATSIPGLTTSKLELHYFGRSIPVAGNRTYEDWSVEFINDEDFKIRNAFEEWSNAINGFESNIRKFATASPAEYKSTAQVIQYSQTGQELRTYKVIGIFPTVVESQELNWENESIQKCKVTFAFDYWQIDASINGLFAGGT